MPTLAPPQIKRALDDREEKIDQLFTRWNDVTPMLTGSHAFDRTHFGDGSEGCSLMPLAWNTSYRKLEMLLRYMSTIAETGSSEFKGMHVHLCEWYGRGEWRRRKVKRIDQFTKKRYEAEEMIFLGGERADPHRVLGALEWLSGYFPGEIYLPKEFVDAA